MVVPTPALAILPFDALVRGSVAGPGESPRFEALRWIGDDYSILYAPSSAVLAALQASVPRSEDYRYLVLGDPVYLPEAIDAQGSAGIAMARPGESILDLQRLRGSGEESLQLAALLLHGDLEVPVADKAQLVDLLGGRRSGRLSTSRLDLRIGSEVRPGVLFGDLRQFTHIHIAAHGHVDGDDARHSGLVFSWESTNQGFEPLEVILGLQLDASLVVLSACDTARGPIVRGEGVQSLANAFIEAGARSVVASLWRIEDVQSAEIMKDFYVRMLGSGAPPERALREAKLHFRREGRVRGVAPSIGNRHYESAANPYYWAPFVLTGGSTP